MNYIQLLSAFFKRMKSDGRLNPNHISLYMALFQLWNLNRFQNPISIFREQVLKLSHIGSNHTYYKCLYDLHDWNYIVYHPSSKPVKGSLISICNVDNIIEPNTPMPDNQKKASNDPQLSLFGNEEEKADPMMQKYTDNSAEMHPIECKNAPDNDVKLHLKDVKKRFAMVQNCIGYGAKMHPIGCKNALNYGAKMHPSINNINKTLKQEFVEKKHEQIFKNENLSSSKKDSKKTLPNPEKEKRKKVAPKKEKDFVVPLLDDVIAFFNEQGYPELEAKKFFYHFQSNGWKVGGKAPMKDWNAASHNWMLNERKFNPPSNEKTNNAVNLKTDKDYDIPL